MAKRKLDSSSNAAEGRSPKRVKGQPGDTAQTAPARATTTEVMDSDRTAGPTASQPAVHAGQKRAPGEGEGGGDEQRKSTQSRRRSHKVRKLAPPRPFPTVPASVSATGPRSAHTEGKNYICITRRTELGAYLRRCKDVLLKDG